jgi:hypothetical protein
MERAEKQGWATGNSSILTINIDGNNYNLIRKYGWPYSHENALKQGHWLCEQSDMSVTE